MKLKNWRAHETRSWRSKMHEAYTMAQFYGPWWCSLFWISLLFYVIVGMLFCHIAPEQSKKLKDIQRRALQIIVGNVPYEEACCMLNFPSLAERRLSMCETLFKQIACESHVLHYLLPAKRDAELTRRMRSMNKYPTVRAQTNSYKNSFVLYALSHF